MIHILNIQEILNELPLVLEYVVPGYIFITLFTYITSRNSISHILTGSVAISFVLRAICSLAKNLLIPSLALSWNIRAIILIAFAILTSILCVWLSESQLIVWVYKKINYKGLHNTVWNDIIDYKNGTGIRLICEDREYYGILDYHEEKGDESWFVLKDYIIEENGNEYKANAIDVESIIAVRLKDVERVELYYNIPNKNHNDKND